VLPEGGKKQALRETHHEVRFTRLKSRRSEVSEKNASTKVRVMKVAEKGRGTRADVGGRVKTLTTHRLGP